MAELTLFCVQQALFPRAEALARSLSIPAVSAPQEGLHLRLDTDGLWLAEGSLCVRGDFVAMLPRLKPQNLNGEMLVRAAKRKNIPGTAHAVDATAGLGEDALLLAAAGFQVTLMERNPIVAALLRDAMNRAAEVPALAETVGRMTLLEGDSVVLLGALDAAPDVVLLDPMFPARKKSGLIGKKLQLLQRLEQPCAEEESLLAAAIAAKPRKVIVKRPLKGPTLAGKTPAYSIRGKAVRYDCIIP